MIALRSQLFRDGRSRRKWNHMEAVGMIRYSHSLNSGPELTTCRWDLEQNLSSISGEEVRKLSQFEKATSIQRCLLFNLKRRSNSRMEHLWRRTRRDSRNQQLLLWDIENSSLPTPTQCTTRLQIEWWSRIMKEQSSFHTRSRTRTFLKSLSLNWRLTK